MAALLVLGAAVALCGLVLLYGPVGAERLLALLGPGVQASGPAIETIYGGVIFGALLMIALAGARLGKVDPLRIGRKPAALLPLGALLGLAGVAASAGYAWLAGSLVAGPQAPLQPGLLLWGTGFVLFGTAVEEIYFRGWLQPLLVRRYGTPLAVLLTSLAFASLHAMGGARSPTTLLNLFLGGLLFGTLAARGSGLAGAVAAHFSWNWAEQILLGLDPNPGVGSFGAWLDLDLQGLPIWGGSDEGLNASLAMTMALIALLVPLLILFGGALPGRPGPRPKAAPTDAAEV